MKTALIISAGCTLLMFWIVSEQFRGLVEFVMAWGVLALGVFLLAAAVNVITHAIEPTP